MDKVVWPILLADIDVVSQGFNNRLVGSFRGAVGFWVVRCRHPQLNVHSLKQLHSEFADQKLVPVRGDSYRETKLTYHD
jgi:hypothetical protein